MLTEAELRRIRANVFDVGMLGELLPADRFAFRGIVILKAIEVTDQEVLSALKRDLIDRESIVSGARCRTQIEEEILRRGVRNIMCAPLRYQDRVIGTLELGSPRPGDLDASHLPKLCEVLPLFAMAVQRSMEELNAGIQTQMKEVFTMSCCIASTRRWHASRPTSARATRRPWSPSCRRKWSGCSSLWPGSDRPCGKALTPTEPPSTRAAARSTGNGKCSRTA